MHSAMTQARTRPATMASRVGLAIPLLIRRACGVIGRPSTVSLLLAATAHGLSMESALGAHGLPATTAVQDTGTERSIGVQLLLRDGAWRSGRLAALDGDDFVLSGLAGNERIAREQVVACMVGSTLPRDMAFLTQLTAGTLVLDDGQLLPGELRLDGDRASWQHRWIGSIPIDLDRVSEIRLRAEARAAARDDADTILLLNGDTLVGFVDSLGTEVLLEALEPSTRQKPDEREPSKDAAAAEPSTQVESPEQSGGASSARRIPVERLAAIAFAQLRESTGSGIAMWLADGTHVRADAVEFDKERGWIFGLADPLLDAAAKPDGSRPIASSPIALLFDPSAMHPLAACRMSPPEPPSEGYRYAIDESTRIEESRQSLLGLGEIALDGGMRVRFAVPDALVAARAPFVFTAEVSLAEPAPPDAAVEVFATIGEGVEARVRLDHANRRRILTLDVAAPSPDSGLERAQLVIGTSDAGNGPAGDRIVLRRAMFLRAR